MIKTHKSVLERYRVPVLTDRSESWAVRNVVSNKNMKIISYIDRSTNEEVLRRVETRRKYVLKSERDKQDSVDMS